MTPAPRGVMDLRLETGDDVGDVVFVGVEAAYGFVAEDFICGGVVGTEVCWW